MHECIGISPRTMMVALLAAVLTLGLGTSDLLAQKPNKPGNGKGKGGGGSGGGSSEYPATMALRDAAGDRILSDGAAYDEGVRIRDDGLLLINISRYGPRRPPSPSHAISLPAWRSRDLAPVAARRWPTHPTPTSM